MERGPGVFSTYMPSQIAHALTGEAALIRADPGQARILLSGPLGPVFRLGCQGPDIFYHSQRTRPLALHYGVLVHRRGYGRLLEGMLDAWVRDDGDPYSPWAAFLLGFATHGALDRAAHPYIVHGSGWTEPGKPETDRFRGCHAFLERILDVLLWERRTGTPVSSFDARAMLVPEEDLPQEFPARMTAALRRAYPSETAGDPRLPSRIANALADTRRFLQLTNPSVTALSPGGPGQDSEFLRHLRGPQGLRIVSVLYPVAFDRSVDWAAEGGRTWVHPCTGGAERREGFFELCEAAETEASGVVRAVLEGLRGRFAPPHLAETAGNGTLNVGDAEGKPARPRFRDPLPLPEAMAGELRARLENRPFP